MPGSTTRATIRMAEKEWGTTLHFQEAERRIREAREKQRRELNLSGLGLTNLSESLGHLIRVIS